MSDDRPTWRPPDQPTWRPPDQDQQAPAPAPPLAPPPTSAPGWAPPPSAPGWAPAPPPSGGPPGYAYWPAHPEPPRRSRRTVALVIGLIVAGIVAVLALLFLIGSSLGSLTQLGTRTPIEDVAIGQCFNGIQSTDFQDNREVSPGMLFGVEVVGCAEEHEAELIGRTTWRRERGDDFPGDQEVETFALNECLQIFEAYVGRSYSDSRLEMTYTFPSQATWNAGSRGFECIVHPPLGVEKEAGSVRGSNR